MSLFVLGTNPVFPQPALADPDGLLAMGGDLSQERLINAYSNGIFPWYSNPDPILWWSPDPRWVLLPQSLKISKSMRTVLRKAEFKVTFDTAFRQVITECASRPRAGQSGTWITSEMKEAYCLLHKNHLAHSVEVWKEDKLVGGLYGVSLGRVFFGESMFVKESNASKAGFIWLVKGLERLGFHLIDCQTHTAHLESLGAESIRRSAFLKILKTELQHATLQQPWTEIPELLLPPV